MMHEHDWKRVPPVVVVLGDPLGLARRAGETTHNAVCECGAKAWLHWPEPRFDRAHGEVYIALRRTS